MLHSTESDINDVVTRIMGLSGQMLDLHAGKSIIPNAVLATKKRGKIWYGDIDSHQLHHFMDILVKELHEPVYLMDKDDEFDFDKGLKFITSSIT